MSSRNPPTLLSEFSAAVPLPPQPRHRPTTPARSGTPKVLPTRCPRSRRTPPQLRLTSETAMVQEQEDCRWLAQQGELAQHEDGRRHHSPP